MLTELLYPEMAPNKKLTLLSLHSNDYNSEVGYLKFICRFICSNPTQCYTCFEFGHHESRCNSCAEPICMHASHADDCQKKLKCVSCGGEHIVTSRSWQREKEIVFVKYRECFSFQDARKIVNSRVVLSGSYAMATKG